MARMVVASYPRCTNMRRAASRILWRVWTRSRCRRSRLGTDLVITWLYHITTLHSCQGTRQGATMTWETMIILSALAALVAVSYLIEALRSAPVAPDRLDWAPDVPIRYVDVKGTKLRYIASGQGPALVLLHTLRTARDLLQNAIRPRAKPSQLHPRDSPGHGLPDTR